jgi:ATP phosphoribosyltransferase
LLLKFNTAAACRLCIAGPKERVFENEKDLNGLRFATSFPLILTRWLAAHDITPKSILVRAGGVEATIAQNRADVICDLVQSGDSLKANNLKSRFVVQDNLCPVLIGRKGVWSESQMTVANLLMRRLEQANKMGQQQQGLRTFPARIA